MATKMSVWIKLYIGEDDKDCKVFEIFDEIRNVDHLKTIIKEKKPNRLQQIDADEIDV